MLFVPARKEIFNACQVLFGSSVLASVDFLKYLQPEGLKTAFRKKVLETHPDRAKVVGIDDEGIMNERFREVVHAYEKLSPLIEAKKRYILRQGGIKTNTWQESQKENVDHFYEGVFPKRKLLIGQFLYYSGIISWRTLIEAIAWQRRQRPLIGRIALDWNLISSYDIKKILTGRDFGEKFGEFALRKGYITSYNLTALLGKQRILQRPIGEHFVERNILSAMELGRMVEKLQSHNREFFGAKLKT